jgi:hypothetical protein
MSRFLPRSLDILFAEKRTDAFAPPFEKISYCSCLPLGALFSYSEQSPLHLNHYLLLEVAHTLIHRYAFKAQNSTLTR